MCLAIPALITELRDGGLARVDMGGVSKEISIALLDECAVGEWVIVHVGYALRKLDSVEAERTLQLFAAGVTRQ
jgi:hydrogenase expression/formation protein HypC